jgi:hypothetical protein
MKDIMSTITVCSKAGILLAGLFLITSLAGCGIANESVKATPIPTNIPTATSPPTQTPTLTATNTQTPTATVTRTITPTVTQMSTPSPLPASLGDSTAFAWPTPASVGPTQTPFPPPESFQGFQSGSLASVIAKYPEYSTSRTDYAILGLVDAVAATVQYSSQFRPLAPSREVLFSFFTASTNSEQIKTYAALFKQELLVREGETEFWVPIQEPLIPYMEDELEVGQLMTIYVRLLGTVQVDQNMEFVFLLNEFHR